MVTANDEDPRVFYWCDLLHPRDGAVQARVVVFNGINAYENVPDEVSSYCSSKGSTVVVQSGNYESGAFLGRAAKLASDYRFVIIWARDADIYRKICNDFKLSATIDRNGNPIVQTKQ